MDKSLFDLIFSIILKIPEGSVATYGQIAMLAGIPRHARLVGYALNSLPCDTTVPWHRVINSKGRISQRSNPGGDKYQRHLLETEGIQFDSSGAVSLERYQWKPDR